MTGFLIERKPKRPIFTNDGVNGPHPGNMVAPSSRTACHRDGDTP
jgi:hypothetical protein